MSLLIETMPNGILQVRETRESGYYRYCIAPGDDYSGYSEDIQSACALAHTAESIAAYRAMMAAALPPEPTIQQLRESMIVTMRQARLALLQTGLLSSVDSAISALPESDKAVAQIEWEYATEVKRDWPWVIALGAALGLTETQIDELFEVARTL